MMCNMNIRYKNVGGLQAQPALPNCTITHPNAGDKPLDEFCTCSVNLSHQQTRWPQKFRVKIYQGASHLYALVICIAAWAWGSIPQTNVYHKPWFIPGLSAVSNPQRSKDHLIINPKYVHTKDRQGLSSISHGIILGRNILSRYYLW